MTKIDMVVFDMAGTTIKDQGVIKIGNTPSDLAEGKNAGCISLGVVNGTHTRAQLMQYENDGLMDDMAKFQKYLEQFLSL